jgi:purine-nucleoside phosphorylase
MPDRHAIVHPVKGRKPPVTGSLAILTATHNDTQLLFRLAEIPMVEQRKLYMSTLRIFSDDQRRFTVVGPFMGAPYAAMIIDTLQVWGVDTILFLGWCGAVAINVKAGDIILPDMAFIDEGTSSHYSDPPVATVLPSKSVTAQARQTLQQADLRLHEGSIWTTDAIFRETVEKVKHFQKKGALAVEMELSAVFSVANFRDMDAAGILVVSDEISSYQWRPGFSKPAFKAARETACKAALTIAKNN